MKLFNKKVSVIFISLILIFNISVQAFAYTDLQVKTATTDISNVIQTTIKNPTVSDIGGEWAVLAVSKTDTGIPKEYKDKYLSNLKTTLVNNKGVLSSVKYTEYARAALTVSALGIDPSNVYSYDLISKLTDYNSVIKQGINGAIWALIALDEFKYNVSDTKKAEIESVKQKYIDYILSLQHYDGGFSLYPDKKIKSDPDITAMVLQAFSKHQGIVKVSISTISALNYLSRTQNSNGCFYSNNVENAESSAQVIMALLKLNIPFSDKRFVKNNNTVVDGLFRFYVKGKGFKHTTKDASVSQMSTEQGFLALTYL